MTLGFFVDNLAHSADELVVDTSPKVIITKTVKLQKLVQKIGRDLL
jgi:hypothetical protein